MPFRLRNTTSYALPIGNAREKQMNAPDKAAVLAHLNAQVAQIAPRDFTPDYAAICLQAAAPRMSDIDRRTRHMDSGTVTLCDGLETDVRWSRDDGDFVIEAVKLCGVWCDPHDVLRDSVIECVVAELVAWEEDCDEYEETLATMRSGPL